MTKSKERHVYEWQQRPLDDVYPVVFLDALVLKVREGGSVQRRACYLALGVTVEGDRDVLGMWFQETEGAKFWMQVLSELKQRGVADILVCCVDGLKGFPEAIEAIYAVTNLLDNARKWSPAGETVDVAVHDGLVEVRDHGPGIAAEDLPLVFNRFYRSASARGMPGAGLGLAIVKQIADAHEGSITVERASGGGTILRLQLSPPQ
jgi:signal transduction histidine kinase